MDLKRSGWILAAGMVFFITITGCIGTEEHNLTIPSSPSPNLTQPVSNETYWIHLDPIPDKHLNDTFVITGRTNIPVGEQIIILTGFSGFPHTRKYDDSLPWVGEYAVSVRTGSGGQNSFSSPPIHIGSAEVKNKTYTDPNGIYEFFLSATYCADNSEVEDARLYHILKVQTPTSTPPPDDSIVYFFYGEGCTHCQNIIPFINNMTEKYPNVPIYQLEIYHNTTNQQIYSAINAAAGISSPPGVPEVVIGNLTLAGEKEIPEKMETYLEVLEKKADNRSLAGNSPALFGGSSSISVLLPLLAFGIAGTVCLLFCRKQP